MSARCSKSLLGSGSNNIRPKCLRPKLSGLTVTVSVPVAAALRLPSASLSIAETASETVPVVRGRDCQPGELRRRQHQGLVGAGREGLVQSRGAGKLVAFAGWHRESQSHRIDGIARFSGRRNPKIQSNCLAFEARDSRRRHRGRCRIDCYPLAPARGCAEVAVGSLSIAETDSETSLSVAVLIDNPASCAGVSVSFGRRRREVQLSRIAGKL